MNILKKELKAKATIHNRFDLIITEYTDESCRKVKKVTTAYGYNTMTNSGLARLVNAIHQSTTNSSFSSQYLFKDYGTYNLGGAIAMGSGTTTPTINDTDLETYISAKPAVYFDKGIDGANHNAYHIRKGTWIPTDDIGATFREIGMGIDSRDGQTNTGKISSRALIVDAEGSPLTITKTSTMQIEVYYKLWITLDHSYDNLEFVGGANPQGGIGINFLYAIIAYNGNGWYTYFAPDVRDKARIYVGSNGDALAYNQFAVKTSLGNRVPTRTTGTNKLIYTTRFGTAEGNGKIKEVGATLMLGVTEQSLSKPSDWQLPLFRALMPVTGVYEGTIFTDVQLGIGDGTEKVFTLQETDNESLVWVWNEINSGSLVVKVNGVETTSYSYNDSTGEITATVANDGVVTASWSVPYIAKSNNYVLDVSYSIEFTNGSVPA